jgi:signal transduction histidine kinase
MEYSQDELERYSHSENQNIYNSPPLRGEPFPLEKTPPTEPPHQQKPAGEQAQEAQSQKEVQPSSVSTTLPYEEQLAAHSTLVQQIIDEVPCGVAIVRGMDARLVLANHLAKNVWGAIWQPGQPIQEYLKATNLEVYRSDGTLLPPEELVAIQAVRNGDRIEQRRLFLHHPNGSKHLLLIRGVALDRPLFRKLRDEKAEASLAAEPWAIILLQDITSLKEAEQLNQERIVLKAAEQMKEDLIAMAAHELRAPLTALMGYTEMLRQQRTGSMGAELAEWQVEALETIAHDVTRLVDLTNHLLDVSRLQAGQLELNLYPANLVALTQRVITRSRAKAKHHTISIKTTSTQLMVHVDVQRIEQVITNLISNAIKYSSEGSQILVTLQEAQDAGVAIISVSDEGIGIPENQQSRIFSRFFRADNANALGIEGTGLGLYLCRELVERHGGRIWFESVEGKGSTFYVSLARMQEQPS